jgi:hypothetical protein
VGGLPAGLVHQYTFNDGTARDSVGAADGVLSGGARIVNGDLVLTGTRGDQHVALPASGPDSRSAINISSYKEVTVACWFTFGSADPRANMWSALFSFGATAPNGSGYAYILGHARNGWTQGLTRAVISNNEPLSGTRWNPQPWERQASGRDVIRDTSMHQFTMTIDAKEIAYYLDGVQMDREPLRTTDTGPTSLARVSTEVAYIGDSVWGPDPSFGGKIHEFSMFNRALTADEVMATFRKGPVPVAGN